VVKESDGNKSPGPDGFNFAFLKAFWELIKGEVRILFDEFHNNGKIPKSFLSYFVTLIPKVGSPFGLADYRPISLIGCLYKLIAKVLAARLSKVMNSIIASSQSAFLKGRNLVDGVLIVNEIVDLAKKTGKECLILKVDFEKAYDSVDWGFLEYMMKRFGFCSMWIEWMRICIFAGNLSVLVNGSPTEEINIQRGLKQGDPLAPFLFLLVAEGFGGVMRTAVEGTSFKGFSIGREGLQISHLQYADDTLCIGEATVQNLWTLKAILRGFEMASGLKVNFWKSCLVGVNVSQDFMTMACTFLNCSQGSIPFNYLGLPIGANARSLSTWEPLLSKLRKKLKSWGNKFFSLGGRIVLLSSVLNSMPIFLLSYLKIPAQVLKRVIRIQREFLWGGVKGGKKIPWVKWNTVCQEKRRGGLGVKDVKVVNLSLLAKWRWRLLQREPALWKDVLVAKYGEHIKYKVVLEGVCFPAYSSRWWKDVCALDSVVQDKHWLAEAVVRRVGNGGSTFFWLDKWCGEAPLCVTFPGFIPSQSKNRVMLGRWANGLMLLDMVIINNSEDSWEWILDKSGLFSVRSTYVSLAAEINVALPIGVLQENVFAQIWKSPAP
ncbi:LINE-1 reverse transcriptase like, partial [Trifolium medium]|nr:LINE-1 reverse transcriptase like [Trifolium medium]